MWCITGRDGVVADLGLEGEYECLSQDRVSQEGILRSLVHSVAKDADERGGCSLIDCASVPGPLPVPPIGVDADSTSEEVADVEQVGLVEREAKDGPHAGVRVAELPLEHAKEGAGVLGTEVATRWEWQLPIDRPTIGPSRPTSGP